MGHKRWRRWLTMMLVLLALPGALKAQASGPTMEIVALWSHSLRLPGWIELQLTLDNEGSDWEGEIVVKDTYWKMLYHLPLTLPAHSHKLYHLPVYIDNSTNLVIRLQSRDGVVEEITLRLRPIPDQDRVCVMADPLTAQALPNCAHHLTVQDAEALPQAASAWETIDLLVMHDFPTPEMTEAQKQALRAWVADGGHLLLLDGVGRTVMLEGMPESLLPVRRVGDQIEPRADARRLKIGEAMVYRRQVGEGRVDWSAGELQALSALWSDDRIPAAALPLAPKTTPFSSYFPTPESLFSVPTSTLPSFLLLPLFTIIYLLFLVALPYVITRRLRRPMLTWVLMPTVILLTLGLLACWLFGMTSGAFPITHAVASIWVPSQGEPARLVGGAATLAPRSRTLSWWVPGYPRPGVGYFNNNNDGWMGKDSSYESNVEIEAQGATARARLPRGIISWGWEDLVEAPPLEFQGKMGADLRLQLATEAPMEAVALTLGPNFLLDIDTPLPGGETTLTLPLTAARRSDVYVGPPQSGTSPCATMLAGWMTGELSGVPFPPPMEEKPDFNARWQVAKTTCYLVLATTDGPPPLPAPQVRGKMVYEGCYFYRVPCPEITYGTFLTIPVGTLEVVGGNGWAMAERGVELIQVGGGSEVTFEFTIPPWLLRGQVSRLKLSLRLDEASFPPMATPVMSGVTSAWDMVTRLSFWDWAAERWVDLPLPSDESVIVDRAAPFVSDEGRVRVRLEGPTLSSVRLSLAVEEAP